MNGSNVVSTPQSQPQLSPHLPEPLLFYKRVLEKAVPSPKGDKQSSGGKFPARFQRCFFLAGEVKT